MSSATLQNRTDGVGSDGPSPDSCSAAITGHLIEPLDTGRGVILGSSLRGGGPEFQGTLKEPLPDGRKLFYTVRVVPDLADKLQARDVKITGAPLLASRRRSAGSSVSSAW